jgi:hypothetical protein
MKVAFASCSSIMSRYQGKQPIWGIIRQQQPNLVLLLGDNVYLGSDGYNEDDLKRKMGMLAKKYDSQLQEKHFKDLLADIPFLATWDNHDFGLPGDSFEPDNQETLDPDDVDPNRDVPIYGADVTQDFRDASFNLFRKKLRSQDMALKKNSPTVYCSKKFTDVNGKTINFFMLDVRSFQTDPNPDSFPFLRRPIPTLLGTDQETWLLRELEDSTAEINVICSGIPYRYWEKYKKWFDAFNSVAVKKSKLLFLGGQVHHNELNNYRLIKVSGEFNPVRIKFDPRHPDDWRPPFDPGTIERTTIYEAVSSGVGQNFKSPIESEEEPLYKNNKDIITNPCLEDLPRNNYGIIDFTDTQVLITLYGQFADDMHYVVIRRSDWKLEGYFSMQKTHLD